MRVSQWETRTGLLRVPRATNTALIPGALLKYQDFPLNIVVTSWQEVELCRSSYFALLAFFRRFGKHTDPRETRSLIKVKNILAVVSINSFGVCNLRNVKRCVFIALRYSQRYRWTKLPTSFFFYTGFHVAFIAPVRLLATRKERFTSRIPVNNDVSFEREKTLATLFLSHEFNVPFATNETHEHRI